MTRDETHCYPIQPTAGYFDAGLTSDNRQVLMGLCCPELVALLFDPQGNLLEVRRRHLEFLRRSGVYVDGEPIEGRVRIYDIYDERIAERLQSWQQEMGFQPQLIKVKRFFLPDLG